MIRLSPSALALDFSRAEAEIAKITKFSPYLHIDVMDGHFVPNLALGECVVKSLRPRFPDTVFDVHLMVTDPGFFAEPFVRAGADIITFHLEAVDDPRALIKKIHALGARAGISVKPKTDAALLLPYLDEADLLLVMTVEPGFGGQALIPECLDKIAFLRDAIDRSGRKIDLEADGGIKLSNVGELTRRGADVIVAGSAVFGAPDPALAAEEMRKAACAAAHPSIR